MDNRSETVKWAIINGDLDQVKEVVEKQKFDVNSEITTRYPVHYAADYGQYEVLSFLLKKGADPNALDKHGITPILAAIWEGHTSCVKLLLTHGVPKDGLAPDGSSYLQSTDKQDIKELLS